MNDTKTDNAHGRTEEAHALVRRPGGTWQREPVPAKVGCEAIQSLVGGYFERLFSSTAQNPFSVYVNEEGLLMKLPYCMTVAHRGRPLDVVGPVVVVRCFYDRNDECWHSVPLEQGDDEKILALGIWLS